MPPHPPPSGNHVNHNGYDKDRQTPTYESLYSYHECIPVNRARGDKLRKIYTSSAPGRAEMLQVVGDRYCTCARIRVCTRKPKIRHRDPNPAVRNLTYLYG